MSGRTSLYHPRPQELYVISITWENVDLNVSPPQICEEPIDIIFENFDLNAP